MAATPATRPVGRPCRHRQTTPVGPSGGPASRPAARPQHDGEATVVGPVGQGDAFRPGGHGRGLPGPRHNARPTSWARRRHVAVGPVGAVVPPPDDVVAGARPDQRGRKAEVAVGTRSPPASAKKVGGLRAATEDSARGRPVLFPLGYFLDFEDRRDDRDR